MYSPICCWRVTGRLSQDQANVTIGNVMRLLTNRLHAVPHSDALAVSLKYSLSAYDARFLALALSVDQRLVTEDRKLRDAAPMLTQSIEDALQSSARQV